MPFVCPVCGYPDLRDSPRSASGGASDEICPSCYFQFGYDDDACGITYEQWRERWIEGGMIWSQKSSDPPEGWDPVEQLKNLTKRT